MKKQKNKAKEQKKCDKCDGAMKKVILRPYGRVWKCFSCGWWEGV